MSSRVHKVPHIRCDSVSRSHSSRESLQSPSVAADSDSFINTLTGFEYDLGEKLAQIDREAEIQAQQLELSECLALVAQLVELFKRVVITPQLRTQYGWQHDAGVTDNKLLDGKVEKIVAEKGLTKEQWNCLIYISYSNGDTTEITRVHKRHLRRLREKAQRLLEDGERNAVFALLKATETHMSQEHLTNN